MTTTTPALRKACIALLTTGAGEAALVAAGVASPAAGGVSVEPEQGQRLPYVEVQGATEVETDRSTSTRSTSSTITMVVRAARLSDAESVAAVVVQTLGRRIDVPGLDGPGASAEGFTNTAGTVDLNGPAYRDEGDAGGSRAVWSIPLRFRYQLTQSASSNE